ncbi:MAG TPA: serine hydrolase domain-containing protein [Vicinamibacterales bacterium]|nr:serine hydrolase domain-containing protein [Vicinamibacterales bacterium]
MKRFALLAIGAVAFTLPLAAGPGALTAGKADDLGFAPDRMPRIREAVQRHVDAGEVSGVVTLVARRGKIAHFEAYGRQDLESKKPMPKDGIFRLASMSKPITAAAVMMMIEEGKVRLTDPVSRFIPEFKGAKVAMPKPGARAGGRSGGLEAAPAFDVVSANRDITIRDLLTHGSGLMSGGLGNGMAPQRGPGDTLATYIPKLGAVPLDFQPGTLWRYSGQAGFDVLSRVVEIASGQPFDQFLKQRLFDPLGMKDTGFSARPDNQARLVTLYQRGPDGTLTKAANQVGLSSTTYFAGSGGMVTTAEDYAQFAQMLLNGGELNGRRHLGTRTVQLMSTNHTGDLVNGQFGRPAAGMGFGLGVQIVEDPALAGLRQSKGSWGWAGAYGTNVTIEPAEKMVTIIMMQTSTGPLQRDFENAVFQAIVD